MEFSNIMFWYISNLNEINSQALREISKVVKEGTSESNSFYPNSNLFNKLSKQSFDKVFVEKNKLSFRKCRRKCMLVNEYSW